MVLETHPLNAGFAWQDRNGPFRVVTGEQAEHWNRLGYFLMKEVLALEQLAALTDALDPLEQATVDFLREKGGRVGISRAETLTFTIHAVIRSAVARAFTRLPIFSDLCADLLGPDCRLYWDQAVYKKPANPEEFPWHQDNGYNFVTPQDYLTCWVPLTPATIDNGCPWVAPGVHRMGTLKHWTTPLGYECLSDPEDTVAIEASPGDIVVFSSLTPHRTGPNLSDSLRKAYIVQFAQDGAEMIFPDGEGQRIPQRHPDRQYRVTRNGMPAN